MTLQQLINSGGASITLKPDEYEGPLVIARRCCLDGQGSTSWSETGPVVTVRAPGVELANLRIEATGESGTQTALRCEAAGTVLRNIEVHGLVAGCGVGGGPTDIPRTIDLGVFAAGRSNVFVRALTLAEPAAVRAEMAGVEVMPAHLAAGRVFLRIATGDLRSGTLVYGEILLVSSVVRRIYVRGRAQAGAPEVHESAVRPQAQDSPEVDQNQDRTAALLRKGQRQDLMHGGSAVTVRLEGTGRLRDLDCYVFCLTAKGTVRGDSDLIFFGQPEGPNGAVRVAPDTPQASIRPDLLDAEIERILVVFSAYEGTFPPGALCVSVKTGSDTFTYPLDGLAGVRTVTAVHLYRRGTSWRLWAADHRSPDGIDSLCAEYGVDVE